MATKKLTENHPFMKRFHELEEKAKELDIHIAIGQYDTLVVTDTKEKIDYYMVDVEDNRGTPDFPAVFDYKLVFNAS